VATVLTNDTAGGTAAMAAQLFMATAHKTKIITLIRILRLLRFVLSARFHYRQVKFTDILSTY
jgi:hypothetical protein